MTIEALFTFAIATTLISLAPGPDNIFVLTQSALYGRKSGVFVTLGLCTGLVFHTLAVALGVAAIFQASTLAFNILKYLGAAYLTYLAWQAFRTNPTNLRASSSTVLSNRALYFRGVIMNITNPKVSIFFLAFLPQFTNPADGNLVAQFLILGAIVIVLAFATFIFIASMAGLLGNWLNHSPRNHIYLNRIAGTVFLGLAAKLAVSSSTTQW